MSILPKGIVNIIVVERGECAVIGDLLCAVFCQLYKGDDVGQRNWGLVLSIDVCNRLVITP